jgi:hypothetical protein
MEDNSIKLKELQVESGTLRKGDKWLEFSFSFLKEFFFGSGWEDGVILPLSERIFV